MVTARLAIGSVSTLAIGALLLGSAPYWLHRSGAAGGTPWGAIASLDANHAEAAPSEDRAQLLKLAALKTGAISEAAPAAAEMTPATPAPQAAAVPAQAAVATVDAAPAVEAPTAPAVEAPQQVASADAPATADPAPEASDRVNINTASASALDHLPGAGRIGHTIVSHRPYKSVKDLVSRRVLRTSDFQKIQSHISVD